MIRRPTPIEELYRWHRDSLAGLRPPVTAGEPQCGWFKMRYTQGGPWVPVAIWLEQCIDPDTDELTDPEVMKCLIGDRLADPRDVWLRCAAKPISEEEFMALARGDKHMTEIRQATHARVNLSQRPVRP